jgi:hypothetical protein
MPFNKRKGLLKILLNERPPGFRFEFNVMELERERQVDELVGRVESLGLDLWKDKVYAYLFREIFKQDRDTTNYMSSAKVLLEKYERLETISLLELAVWKDICIMNPGKPSNNSFFWFSWATEGWKTIKGELYDSRDIAIIMSSIVPFLY